jgi:glycosyltransferase involved in cell wall biosynthesis
MGDLEIGYDSSTFDTDPFEPQPDGLGTIFPLWVPGNNGQKGFVELPYTLPQDHTLFILMREKNIDIWKRKLNWIAEKGGMALLITHPDYMSFNATSRKIDEYPAEYYEEFLKYVKSEYGESYWLVRPQEVAEFTSCQAPYPPNKRQFRTRRMRACMLSYSFYESDNRVIRYAEALAERGERVDVIALRKEGQADFEVMNGVNVYRVQERILDEKGKFSYISRLLRFLYKSSVFVSRQHLREPYELVHVHTVPDFEVFAGFLPKLSGASLILDIHDILPEFYASKFKCGPKSPIFKILTIIEKASAGFSDHIIISNHLWAEKVAVRSAKKDKCTVILNYPDLGIFYPRLKKCKDGKVIFLYPGTLNWHQGLDIAIQAFSSIKDKIPEAEFHIYGRGSETNLLQEMIVSLDLTDRVIQRPSVPISKIADVMANADIGLVPKRNDLFGAEAFSTKILEFMSLGIPVIVARTKIDNYYFDDSVVRFFEPGNIDDLAKSMLELVRNKHLRESLSQKATKFVEDFVWQKKKWEYLDLVDRLTGSVRRK